MPKKSDGRRAENALGRVDLEASRRKTSQDGPEIVGVLGGRGARDEDVVKIDEDGGKTPKNPIHEPLKSLRLSLIHI